MMSWVLFFIFILGGGLSLLPLYAVAQNSTKPKIEEDYIVMAKKDSHVVDAISKNYCVQLHLQTHKETEIKDIPIHHENCGPEVFTIQISAGLYNIQTSYLPYTSKEQDPDGNTKLKSKKKTPRRLVNFQILSAPDGEEKKLVGNEKYLIETAYGPILYSNFNQTIWDQLESNAKKLKLDEDESFMVSFLIRNPYQNQTIRRSQLD